MGRTGEKSMVGRERRAVKPRATRTRIGRADATPRRRSSRHACGGMFAEDDSFEDPEWTQRAAPRGRPRRLAGRPDRLSATHHEPSAREVLRKRLATSARQASTAVLCESLRLSHRSARPSRTRRTRLPAQPAGLPRRSRPVNRPSARRASAASSRETSGRSHNWGR